MNTTIPDYLTVNEIAQRWGVTRQRVHQIILDRDIPTERVGRTVVLHKRHSQRPAKRAGGRGQSR